MLSPDTSPPSPAATDDDLVDWKAFDSLLDITEAWEDPKMMIDLLAQ